MVGRVIAVACDPDAAVEIQCGCHVPRQAAAVDVVVQRAGDLVVDERRFHRGGAELERRAERAALGRQAGWRGCEIRGAAVAVEDRRIDHHARVVVADAGGVLPSRLEVAGLAAERIQLTRLQTPERRARVRNRTRAENAGAKHVVDEVDAATAEERHVARIGCVQCEEKRRELQPGLHFAVAVA